MKRYTYRITATRIAAPRRARAVARARVSGTGPRAALKWLLAVATAAAFAFGITNARSQTLQAGTAAPTTAEYVHQSAAADMFAAAAGRLALQKSQDPGIRAFAQQMIDVHGRSKARLEHALKAASPSVALPATLDGRHARELGELRSQSAAQFEARYLQTQILAHRNALDLQRAYAQSGDNGALKRLALERTPTVQRHLATLEMLTQQSVVARVCSASEIPAAAARAA